MFEEIDGTHRRNGALVDTNLFLLLLVGRYDLSKLEKFRATQKYNTRTYNLLEELLSHFSKLYTTPNIITEVDNLSRQTGKNEWVAISGQLAQTLTHLNEEMFSSTFLASHVLHSLIGVTDCSAFEMSSRGILVITDDLPLTIALEKQRRPVINLSRYVLDVGL